MRVIRAVTFDFWNTIARVPAGTMSEARRRAVLAACAEGGAEVEPRLVAAALQQVGQRWERSWGQGVHLHPREGGEMLVRALGVEETAGELVIEAFLAAAREVELELAPDIGPALEALRSRGMRIGIVCDVGFSGGALLRDLLDREGLIGHFDGWAFSDETGHYKPAPQAFEAALASLGARPQEAMHVGDLRRTDVAGAAALRMRTVRYRGMNEEAEEGWPEADYVVDSHLELVELVELARMTSSLPADTGRLRFRRLGMEDLDELLALHEDPAVARYMGEYDRAGMEGYLRMVEEEWGERGHGRVAILDRTTGSFLGRSGLKHWPQFGETEVGWVLRPEMRGRGYATEAARAALAWGFDAFDLPYVTAMIQPDNAASARVAGRLGMRPIRCDELLGAEVVVYALSREDWERS